MTSNAPFFVDNEVIVILKNGTWMADGMEISHEPTRKLFAKSLFRDEQGYILKIGRETKRIEVEDTAYFVHRIDHENDGAVRVWVNDEVQEILDPSTLKYQPGRLTCQIERHSRTEEAKFLSAAYFDLLSDLKESPEGYWLEIQGRKVTLLRK
ncbi:MAG: DUF1285 domain-containing protein [Bdellovibrionales bacterium]|nr:DUF1285 domain-containing protein [Bdellovibrionales bacterium]